MNAVKNYFFPDRQSKKKFYHTQKSVMRLPRSSFSQFITHCC